MVKKTLKRTICGRMWNYQCGVIIFACFSEELFWVKNVLIFPHFLAFKFNIVKINEKQP